MYDSKNAEMNLTILNRLEMLYFPQRCNGSDVDIETAKSMEDDDDKILENDDDNGTTLNEREDIDLDGYMSDNDLEQTTTEDIILARILGQKPNGVITRSSSVRHQDELYIDMVEATTYNVKDTIDLDDDDVDIIDIITGPTTTSSSSSTTTSKKRKKGNLTT